MISHQFSFDQYRIVIENLVLITICIAAPAPASKGLQTNFLPNLKFSWKTEQMEQDAIVGDFFNFQITYFRM